MADEVATPVPPELDGERVDKALAVLLDVSRAIAREIVDTGVTMDELPVKPSDRVVAGAVIRSPEAPSLSQLVPEAVEFGVLFEDEHLLVVDKPAGLVVHPGARMQAGTLAAGLLHRYPEIEGVGDPGRWGLVHRLDKDTSGAMVVARDAEAFQALKQMIKRREVGRIYTALVDGVFSAPTGTIDSPIGRDRTRPARRAIATDGKRAVTHYEVLEAYPAEHCSLVEVKLETGRTHQIRVHFTAIGHPVIGDRTYGTKTTRAKSPRQFLHARRLEFTHPIAGQQMIVESPLPPDLAGALAAVSSE